MKTYRIVQTSSGVDLGEYQGETPEGAIRAMLADAGCTEEPDPGLIATPMHEPAAGPWEAHDDDGTGTLSCVLSEHVNPSGTFYVAQCNRFSDAQFIAAAPEVADALEAFRDARMLIVQEAREEALLVADMLAEAALRKAGRLS